jgi:single-stranded DNA-binding protein
VNEQINEKWQCIASLTGRVSYKKPIAVTKNGHSVVQMSIGFPNSKQQGAEWTRISLSAFNDAAEALKDVQDGSVIRVNGALSTQTYKGKDGVEKLSVRVAVFDHTAVAIVSTPRPKVSRDDYRQMAGILKAKDALLGKSAPSSKEFQEYVSKNTDDSFDDLPF